MRSMLALLLILLLLPCAALAGETSPATQTVDPTVVYSASIPRPIAALLPGVPVSTTDSDSLYTYIRYPSGNGCEYGRIDSGAALTDEPLDAAKWPEAQVLAHTSYDSFDLGLCYGDLTQGETVRVMGLCNGYWYVYNPANPLSSYGCVRLDDLDVDSATAETLRAMLPGFAPTGAEGEAMLAQVETEHERLISAYGPYRDLWPLDEQVSYADLCWCAGYYWEDAYVVLPTRGDLTQAQAIEKVKAYARETFLLDIPEDAVLGASFELERGRDLPQWHIYWHTTDEIIEFTISSECDGVEVEYSRFLNSWVGVSMTIEQRHAVCVAAGWSDNGDNQLIAEGCMEESAARELAVQYLCGGQSGDDALVLLRFYDTGTVMPYDWPWEDWCETRPVFRANLYQWDGSYFSVLGEAWFDAQTGELYRLSEESSGNG